MSKKIDKDKKDSYTEDSAEEVTFEMEEEEVMEGSLNDKLKKLRTQLGECEAEKSEHLAGWQRAKADLINARREAEEESIRRSKFATTSLIEELLPVLDSFSMARGNVEAWESVDANWRKGMEQVHSQLESVLKSQGLEEIMAQGEVFDPERHDAAGTIPVSVRENDNVVQNVIQPGYQIWERVIRPARVIVGEYSEE